MAAATASAPAPAPDAAVHQVTDLEDHLSEQNLPAAVDIAIAAVPEFTGVYLPEADGDAECSTGVQYVHSGGGGCLYNRRQSWYLSRCRQGRARRGSDFVAHAKSPVDGLRGAIEGTGLHNWWWRNGQRNPALRAPVVARCLEADALATQGAQASSGSSEPPPAASHIAVDEASPVWVIWADRPDLSGKYRPHAASDRRSECPVEWIREAQQGLYKICYQASKHPFGGGSPHPVWALRDVDGIGVYATADALADVSSPTQSDWGLFEVCDSPPPAPEAIHVTVSLLTCAAFARELIQHDRDRIATGDITPWVLTFQPWLRLPEDIVRCVIEFTPAETECSWWRLAGLPIPERCETDLNGAESVICSDDLSLFMVRQLCGTYYKSPRRCKDGQPQWVLEGSELRAAVTSANGRWCLSLQGIAAPELTLAESMEIHCEMPPDQMVWGWSVQGTQDGAGVTVTRAPDFPRAVSSGTLPRAGSSGGFPRAGSSSVGHCDSGAMR